MNVRNNFTTNLIFKGEFKKLNKCKGPNRGKNKGMDFPCCLRCNNFRNCANRDDRYEVITDLNVYKYLTEMEEEGKIQNIKQSLLILNCGDEKNMIYSQMREVDLEYSNYSKSLLYQMEFLSKRGLIPKKILAKNFTITDLGIPIFIPDFNNIEIREKYGGDEGVEILEVNGKKLFRVIDHDEAFKSGKWYFMINFLKAEFLTRGENISFKHNNKNYFVIKDNTSHAIEKKFIIEKTKPEKIIKEIGHPDDKYVVLDLDSTLIFSQKLDFFQQKSNHERFFNIKLVVDDVYYRVLIRKHVEKFLTDLVKHGYKIIVWSAGCENYVKVIVSVLFKNIKIVKVLTVNDMVDDNKNLRILDKHIENIKFENCRLVDDNDSYMENQSENLILIEPFIETEIGDLGDDDILENFIERINLSFNK